MYLLDTKGEVFLAGLCQRVVRIISRASSKGFKTIDNQLLFTSVELSEINKVERVIKSKILVSTNVWSQQN